MTLNLIANEVLSLIELEENKLLQWGFVNGELDLLHFLAGKSADLQPFSPDQIIDNLLDRRLIFQTQRGYRSRFAEAVRLLFLLKQRFSVNDWLEAPRLVSDFKLALRRRQYPKRNVSLAELQAELQRFNITPLQQRVIKTLLQDKNGNPFQLAQFQCDATIRQFDNLQQDGDRALAIGAGTGAGKTKAFYIPALAHVAEELERLPRTQVIAIYPRTELLKDQLKEAFNEARKLDSVLQDAGKRPITIGAYYGDVPTNNNIKKSALQNWARSDEPEGYHCPYFVCPDDEAKMVWRTVDIKDNRAVLVCSVCGREVGSRELLLTRQQMIQSPPDILFTTTEMLNRRLLRGNEHHLFGIGVQNPPRLVLLDEIHTYEGLVGAQIGYLLRRWQFARKQGNRPKNLCIVGLSATLTQADRFFAKLTGLSLDKQQVSYIEPSEDELDTEGMEYNIVLKGNPATATSLLSTTVQAMMLLGRIQDHEEDPASEGAYGQKVFGFTDKLDVINRWFYIQYDAEQRRRLARFRSRDLLQQELDLSRADLVPINEQGQLWAVAGIVGHELENGLRLGRTTSQDRGYDNSAELVIATSTLEVGFNDPLVGAVIQHKAPRSMASFLQRKGRAGRKRAMRPWMLVVTSNYGRDRWAFQHATQLFDPQLPPSELPLENDYVRKIQASFAFLDWLTLKLKQRNINLDGWNLFTNNKQRHQGVWQPHRQIVCDILRRVLNGSDLDSLKMYLSKSLGLNETEINIVLWREPRSLLFNVIPTALRQLETQWQLANQDDKWLDRPANHPLPDFVPSALFNDLNLPEVTIQFPDEGMDDVMMGLTQTLVEFAPGRANKRFMLTHARDTAHWLRLPEGDSLTLNLESWDDLQFESHRVISFADEDVTIFRPISYNLQNIPENIKSTSYGELLWRSRFMPQTGTLSQVETVASFALPINIPTNSQWRQFLTYIDLFTQMEGTWVEVSRLAERVQTDTKYTGGQSERRITRFVTADEKPAAIGFHLAVDALRFTFIPPDLVQLRQHPDWLETYRALCSHYFLDLLQQDPRLAELTIFEREWLWIVELSLLTMVAVERQCSLQESAEILNTQRGQFTIELFRYLFQGGSREEDADNIFTERVPERLWEYLNNPEILSALVELETILWQPEGRQIDMWLSDCYVSSLGATIFTVVTQLVPDIDPDDLVMDIDADCIWVSEKSLGGVGLITKIADQLSQYPRHFELKLLDTLAHCERAQLAAQLNGVATLISHGNSDLQNAFVTVRQQTDLPTLLETQAEMAKILEINGIPATRQLFVEMNNKFLRGNSANDSDQLIANFVEHWHKEEERLGIHIDLRVMAVAGLQIPAIQQQVQQLMARIDTGITTRNQSYSLLQSLLWLNCHDSCPDCIETWNPYQQQVHPSRQLLRLNLRFSGQIVHYGSDYWEERVQESLMQLFEVSVICSASELADCKAALLMQLTSAVDIGFQTFYPIVERIERHNQAWRIHLAIQELVGE